MVDVSSLRYIWGQVISIIVCLFVEDQLEDVKKLPEHISDHLSGHFAPYITGGPLASCYVGRVY